jgi:hypothetical protein
MERAALVEASDGGVLLIGGLDLVTTSALQRPDLETKLFYRTGLF